MLYVKLVHCIASIFDAQIFVCRLFKTFISPFFLTACSIVYFFVLCLLISKTHAYHFILIQ